MHGRSDRQVLNQRLFLCQREELLLAPARRFGRGLVRVSTLWPPVRIQDFAQSIDCTFAEAAFHFHQCALDRLKLTPMAPSEIRLARDAVREVDHDDRLGARRTPVSPRPSCSFACIRRISDWSGTVIQSPLLAIS